MTNIRRKARFSLGKAPLFDPCKDCVVGMVCDPNKDMCIDKAKYMTANETRKSNEHMKMKKVKKQNVWRNINGIRK